MIIRYGGGNHGIAEYLEMEEKRSVSIPVMNLTIDLSLRRSGYNK